MEYLKVEDLNFFYNNKPVLRNINLVIDKPGFYVILGPNGSGKTTLLRNIARLLSPFSGKIWLYERDIRKINRKTIAKLVSFVPQKYDFRYPFTVGEVLAMGKYPYMSLFDYRYEKYRREVEEVASFLGIDMLLTRPITSLSGGQAKKVMIGRVLIQDTPIYLLDEPIVSLDVKYKLDILNYFKKISREKVIIATFHELEFVGIFADWVMFIKKGKIFTSGRLDKVFTPINIKEVFNIDVEIERRKNMLKMDINWEVSI